MPDELPAILEQFQSKQVLVMGEFVLDKHSYGDARSISPEAPVPVLRLRNEVQRAGGAGHVASALSTLGCQVACCGVVGDDAAGHELLTILSQSGAATNGLIQVPGRKTATYTRLIGLAQHRHPQQMMRVEQVPSTAIPDKQVESLIEFVRRTIHEIDAVCVSDSEDSDLPEALCQATIDATRQARKPILIDFGRVDHVNQYRGATVLTLNRGELAAVCGQQTDQIPRIGQYAKPLAERLGLKAIVVTLDRDGALVVPTEGEPTHVPTRPRAVYDITGAGNIVLALLTASLATGATLEQGTQLANIAAGLSVERFGAVSVSMDEIRAELVLEGRAAARKLRTLDELMAELAPRRAAGSKVVFTNGCFDVLHAGHIQYFKFCRDQGDIVVVGLNSDDSVRAQGKGDDRPINTQLDRARMLSALESVDHVVIFDEPTPENMIRRILPDVLVKGGDWAKWVCGKEIVEAAGGRVVLAPMMEGYSTTQLVNRIRRMEARRERDT